ncbi:Dynamin-related protein 3A [Bienertia sinuspersici]
MQDICSQSRISILTYLPQVAFVRSQVVINPALLKLLLVAIFFQESNSNNGGDGLEHGEFLHLPGKKFY